MLRKLLIVFVSGVILSIVAFGGAWIAGGDALKVEPDGLHWNWTFDDDDKSLGGLHKTRAFNLKSGSQVKIGIPVELDFVRGERPQMTVEGPADIVDKLVWENGRLFYHGSLHHNLKVRITAPEIGGLDLDAPGEVKMTGLDQQELHLNFYGPISLDASGNVQRMFVTAEGAGDLDLGHVQGKDATIRVDGAGDVKVGATGTVDVEINGAGNVTLVRKPATLRSRLNGIGNIEHAY